MTVEPSEEHYRILNKLKEIFAYRLKPLSEFRFQITFDQRPEVRFRVDHLSVMDMKNLVEAFETVWVEAPSLFDNKLSIKVCSLK